MDRKGVGERVEIMLGIDVSKATLTCARINDNRTIVLELEIPNTEEGLAQILQQIPADVPWVVEPTGRYSDLAVKTATEAGRQVLIAPPRKAKSFLQSQQSRVKSDKVDCRGLAAYGQACTLRAYPIKEPDVDKVDQLLSVRKNLAKTIMRFKLQEQTLPLAASWTAVLIADSKDRLKQLDKEIEELTKSSPAFEPVARLDEIQGVGPVIAAAVCSRLTAKQFVHPDQFIAYCGLDIGVRQSGKRSGQTGLSKQGDAELRRLLYLAAQSNLRCKASPFKDLYHRKRAGGMSSTAALCVVARKIGMVCWSLHKHGTTYDPSRVGAAPVVSETEVIAPVVAVSPV